jgi:hypothetical protein
VLVDNTFIVFMYRIAFYKLISFFVFFFVAAFVTAARSMHSDLFPLVFRRVGTLSASGMNLRSRG